MTLSLNKTIIFLLIVLSIILLFPYCTDKKSNVKINNDGGFPYHRNLN